MIKVSVFYPKTPSSRFDNDYYFNRHMPMVKEKLGASLKRTDADQGLAGGTPGSPPIYAAMCHLYFDSVQAFQAAFEPHAKVILSDIPNYTNVEPIMLISEVKMG